MNPHLPLSEQLRPQSLHDIEGQEQLVGPEGLLTKIIQNKHPVSILLWGPPGCGKTTIARLYAQSFGLDYHALSPIHHGIQEIKKLLETRSHTPLFSRGPVLIFVDEIHRFNKAQQDLFLPYLENGSLILIGATTENPSFALNNALLSRLRTLTLKPLTEDSLARILKRYLTTESSLSLEEEIQQILIQDSQGDARHLYNLLENCKASNLSTITLEHLPFILQKKLPQYDRNHDGHYHLISALHKSLRGSDPQAALYYLTRMLQAGEDPHFIARRLVRFAVEDVGLADLHALNIALHAWNAFKQLGSPEGELALVQCTLYLALSPKSNKVYLAYQAAQQHAQETSHLSPPSCIVNAPTKLMTELGYGEGYLYDHNTAEGFSGQEYFPPDTERQEYYQPREIGFERELNKRLAYFQQLKKNLRRGRS
jgi:putative ATPase